VSSSRLLLFEQFLYWAKIIVSPIGNVFLLVKNIAGVGHMDSRSFIIALKYKTDLVFPCWVVMAIPVLFDELFRDEFSKDSVNIATPIAKFASHSSVYFCRRSTPLFGYWAIGQCFPNCAYWSIDDIILLDGFHKSHSTRDRSERGLEPMQQI